MMGEAEKQKAIRALFPSTAGVLEGEDGRAAQSQGEVGGTRSDGMGWDGVEWDDSLQPYQVPDCCCCCCRRIRILPLELNKNQI